MSSSSFGGAVVPFVNHLGFLLVKMEAGDSQVDFDPRPEHCEDSIIHQGVLLTLLDVTLATSTRTDGRTGAVTIEMKANFLQPARGKVSGKGRLVHRNGSMAFAEGTIYDAEGRACATASGTFKNVPRRNQNAGVPGTVATD
jgi:uncharacterized protein (TIGR00369 family)